MRRKSYPSWSWDKMRSMRERREASIGPPTLIDILASIGPRDDRGGGDEPTRGE